MPKDIAPDPQDVLRQTALRYDIFNPRDHSEGFADRVANVIHRLEARRDLIQAALDYSPGTHTFDQVVKMVLEGVLTFWCLPNSFMLSEIHNFPNARHYHIFLGGGELDEITAMHGDVEPVARALGCSKLTICGRQGWVRALAPHGWKPYLITLGKDL